MNRPTPGQRRHVRSCHQSLSETEAKPFDPEMSFMTNPDSPFVSGSSFFDQQGLDLNGRRRWPRSPGRVETAANLAYAGVRSLGRGDAEAGTPGPPRPPGGTPPRVLLVHTLLDVPVGGVSVGRGVRIGNARRRAFDTRIYRPMPRI